MNRGNGNSRMFSFDYREINILDLFYSINSTKEVALSLMSVAA